MLLIFAMIFDRLRWEKSSHGGWVQGNSPSRFPDVRVDNDIDQVRRGYHLLLLQGWNGTLRAYRADRTQYYPGINAGSLALARGEDTQAEEIFKEVLDTCNSLREHVVVSYWVDFSAGEAHLGLGDVEEALLDYQRSLARTPSPPSRDRLSAIKGARRMLKAKGLADSIAERIERVLA
jgi:tetratricopeptide (TPR) repeat protein